MSAWTAKRFWTKAHASPCDVGFTVHLDARAVKTPAKRALILPTWAMAQAVAAEWEAQHGLVKPQTMPFTRMANSALDKVAVQFSEVAGLLAAYGNSDLLCYRASTPDRLIARQAAAWDALVQWSADALDAPLIVTHGVVHVDQPKSSQSILWQLVHGFSPFQLAAVHDLVAISGSLVLALAVTREKVSADQAWTLSRLDETWTAEQWGRDAEAEELEAVKHAAFLDAARFFALCGSQF